jgi:predicted HNH restriction endonuclease
VDLFFRLSQDKVEGFENIVETKNFFNKVLPTRDKNYFFHTKKMNEKKLQNGDIIYFAYDNYIVAKAKFLGEIKPDTLRNEKFIYGHKLNNVEVINSNIQLNTKIVSTRTTYIDNAEKQNELERVLKSDIIYPDEIEDNDLFEGTKKQITVNAYERSSQARQECINEYGYKCVICNFDFENIYGEIGHNFIHVHHIKPLSEIDEKYKINPIEDLRPVCPNCHAMLHKRKPAYGIKEIQDKIKQTTYNK